MKCPIDQSELVMTDRQGIEIDYCPQCRGVWLDRGELDKIIERSEQTQTAPSQQPYQEPHNPQRHDDYYDSRNQNGYQRKHKGSFLSDLFD